MRRREEGWRLTDVELEHLWALLYDDQLRGDYSGRKDYYYARTQRLLEWVSERLSENER